MKMKSVLEGRPALAAVIDQVAEVAGYLWQKGWAERNGGNITVNVTDLVDDEIKALPAIAPARPIGKILPNLKGTYFYAKGTGKRMRDLARRPMENGAIIRVCDDCASYEIIADNAVLPTSELPSHLSLQDYLIGTGSCYKATLHTHPIELVAMSHIQRFLRPGEMTRVLPSALAWFPMPCPAAWNWRMPRWSRLRHTTLYCGRSTVPHRSASTSWTLSTRRMCSASRPISICVPAAWALSPTA